MGSKRIIVKHCLICCLSFVSETPSRRTSLNTQDIQPPPLQHYQLSSTEKMKSDIPQF